MLAFVPSFPRFTMSKMATTQLPVSPFIYLPIQLSLIASLIAFSSPASFLRPCLLPIIVICNYALLSTYSSYITRTPWIAFVSGASLGQLLDYVEKLLLCRWSYEQYGPKTQTVVTQKTEKGCDSITFSSRRSKLTETFLDRLKFGFWVASSNRYIASPYQSRNVPPYSYSDPSFVPTRSDFLLKNAATLVLCYLIIDLLAQGEHPDKNPTLYGADRVYLFTRLDDVTIEELITRTITSVLYWVAGYFVVQGYYTGLAWLSVASGFDRPELWRPNFGPLSQVYTIRGFWG